MISSSLSQVVIPVPRIGWRNSSANGKAVCDYDASGWLFNLCQMLHSRNLVHGWALFYMQLPRMLIIRFIIVGVGMLAILLHVCISTRLAGLSIA
jgi:hypothetical protein